MDEGQIEKASVPPGERPEGLGAATSWALLIAFVSFIVLAVWLQRRLVDKTARAPAPSDKRN